MPVETARAKINLSLHVGRLVADPNHKYFGYHPLDSLVAFAEIGDEVSCEEAAATSLTISGPFADGLEADENNLILKAYAAVTRRAELPPLKFHLVKNLPVASGIGGGSADAAAALRLMKNYVDLPEAIWLEIALSLGADVPVCYYSKTAQMRGIGEELGFKEDLGTHWMILSNPGITVSTASVFKAFDANSPAPLSHRQGAPRDLLAGALAGHNDLEPVSMMLYPEVSDTLRIMAQQPDCQLARMSGSGATCFGLFDREAQAREACATINRERPHAWVVATRIGDPA